MEPTLNIPYEGFAYLPHQDEGVKWLLSREVPDAPYFRGGILADDMGLGKTWQLIGLILNSLLKKTLLVVPASLIETWTAALIKANITTYTCPQTNGIWQNLYRSTGVKRKVQVHIISYDRYVNSCKGGRNMHLRKWDRVVCDEAQNIRNGKKTKRFKKLMKLGPCCRWLLTGTPFQNKIDDLYNLFSWLQQGKSTTIPIETLVRETLLRRTYSDLRTTGLDGTPEPYIRKNVPCIATSEQEKDLLEDLLNRLDKAKSRRTPPLMILEMFLRVNQAMAHPQIYFDSMEKKFGKTARYMDWTGKESGKTVALKKLLATEKIAPTIVFCTFSAEIKIVEQIMQEAGYSNTYTIDGSVGFANRQDSILEAKALVEQGTKDIAFIVQWVAGGAGLNLQFCSRVILNTQNWNPAVIQQAIGRAHRIGQTEQVHVYSLLFSFEDDLNMDLRMTKRQAEKMEDAHEVLSTLLEEDLDSRVTQDSFEVTKEIEVRADSV
jgi:hypothetical protein